MLDIVLIILLVLGFLIGIKRGLILQLVHLISFAVSFIVAYLLSDDLAPRLKIIIPLPNWQDQQGIASLILGTDQVESAFYRIIAFAILFFGTQILLRIVGFTLNSIAQLPILKQLNKWGGGILGFVEIYVVLFILLYIGAVLPVLNIQQPIQQSGIATAMIQHTPFLSATIHDLLAQYGQL